MLGGKHWGAIMPHYCLWSRDDESGETYWVMAASPDYARRLVHLNAGDGGREAEDPEKFMCKPDTNKEPPDGLIYRRLAGPLTITRR